MAIVSFPLERPCRDRHGGQQDGDGILPSSGWKDRGGLDMKLLTAVRQLHSGMYLFEMTCGHIRLAKYSTIPAERCEKTCQLDWHKRK